MNSKLVRTGLLVSTLMLGLSFISFAKEDDDEGIGAITLNIEGSYSSGDEVDEDDFTVDCDTDGVNLEGFELDYKSATKNDGEEWSKYDTPVLVIYLSAEDGYYFDKTSKGSFKLEGDKAEFVDAKRSSDKYEVELTVRLSPLSGNVGNVYNLYWSDTSIGHWSKGYNNKTYDLKLYCNDSLVKSYETSNLSYDFANDMKKAGSYYFSVRGVGSSNKTTDYIESEVITITDVQANNLAYKAVDNTKTNSSTNSDGLGTSSSSSTSKSDGPSLSVKGSWVETPGVGWWYRYTDGSWPANKWEFINNNWYYFDDNGYMATGWRYVKNHWYYLESSGAMATGWKYIDNKWYYLDASGAMVMGWQNINGKKYYMDASGAMLIGNQMVDGNYHLFDNSGALVN